MKKTPITQRRGQILEPQDELELLRKSLRDEEAKFKDLHVKYLGLQEHSIALDNRIDTDKESNNEKFAVLLAEKVALIERSNAQAVEINKMMVTEAALRRALKAVL
jgi:hypothetical protein